jgi:endonuclease/exonuclease/phosphatase family metal-dependent hydrolase
MKIKILQWNTWYKEDIEKKISLLGDVDADIYCLQELSIVDGNNEFDIIKESLNLNGFLGVTETDHGGQGNAILTKHPIISSNSQLIKDPKEPRQHFSDEGRIYLESNIEINDSVLTVGTTHMSYTDRFEENELKRKESQKLLDILEDHSSSYIFTGDLNATEESKLVKSLESNFMHAGPSYSEKTWTTKDFDYNGFNVSDLEYRLDFVFTTRDLKVINSTIVNTDYSDHLPILVEIEV